MPSTRLKGNVTPIFSLSNLTSPASADLGPDAVSINLTDGEGEQVTFSDYAQGDSSKAFEATFVYSGDANSAYDILWRNAGKTGVAFVWGPHGNSTAAAGKPTYSGTLTLPAKPNLETEASATDPSQFEVEIQIDTITRNTL
jgi:hypothetical protein